MPIRNWIGNGITPCMAILGLRKAVNAPLESLPGKRIINATEAPKGRIFAKRTELHDPQTNRGELE